MHPLRFLEQMDEGAIKPRPYPNIPAIFGLLISKRLCTLHELRTIYSFKDAMYMYEAYMVPKYNEWREYKAYETRGNK